jgi:hypothetical protein
MPRGSTPPKPAGSDASATAMPLAVQLRSRTRAASVEGDQPKMAPRVDAPHLGRKFCFEESDGLPMAAGVMQVGCFDDQVAVPVVLISTGNDLLQLEARSQSRGDRGPPQRMQRISGFTPVLGDGIPFTARCQLQRHVRRAPDAGPVADQTHLSDHLVADPLVRQETHDPVTCRWTIR